MQTRWVILMFGELLESLLLLGGILIICRQRKPLKTFEAKEHMRWYHDERDLSSNKSMGCQSQARALTIYASASKDVERVICK